MRRLLSLLFPLLAVLAIGVLSAPVHAAASGVQDDGHFFSPDAIRSAEQVIDQIHAAHKKDVRVVTFAALSDEQKAELEAQGKNPFFEHWAESIGKRDHVNGIVILACKEPGHLQVDVGNTTREKAFTMADKDELVGKMLGAFKAKNYDEGLTQGVRFIQARIDQNLGAGRSAGAAQNSAPSSTPPVSIPPVYGRGGTGGFSWAGWLCLGVGILVVVFFIMNIFNRNRGGGYGAAPGGYPPVGGYPPNAGGGYQQGGGYYGGGPGGGGGSGFGRGMLGGLLGGALGAWGYDKLSGRGNTGYAAPPPAGSGGDFNTGGGEQPDTSYSGSGGDFGSSAPDSSSGGDFGGSSDMSGSGGDFGGGGDSGGGDSGGGGGGGDF